MTFTKEESFFETQPMFVCDQQTLNILDVNNAAVQILGYSKKEFLTKRILDYAKQTDLEKAFPDLCKSEKPLDNKIWTINNKKGETLYFQLSANLINYKGRPAKIVIAHNVTRTLENNLSKKILSTPLNIDNFPLAEIEWDTSLKIIRWSEKAEELFGWTEKEAVKKERLLENLIHPDDIDSVNHEIRDAIQHSKKKVCVINRNFTKNGKTIYCEWHHSLLYNENGKVISIYSMAHDVTAREDAMEHAKRSMKSYQDLFNSISDAIYLLNYKGEILEANKGLEYTFGYEREEVIGEHYRLLAAPGKYNEQQIEEISEKAEEGKPSQYTGWGKRNNGEVFPTEFLVNYGSYYGEDVIIVIERDVSHQKAYEDALKKREGLFSKLFNSSPIGIALLNEHKEVEIVNEGFEHIFGWKEEELKGLDLDRVIVPEKLHEEATRLSESEKVLQVTDRRVRKDGKMVDVIIYAVPVIVESSVVGIYGIYVDITKRQEAEAQIKKSLKEKEVLLAEIHHRVKNNLAVITGLLELQSYSAEHESARRTLKDSQMRVSSIALVHEKLYQSESFSEIEVGQYFAELTEEVHRSMSTEGVEVDIKLNIDSVHLPITQAIPCGLLVNEIITNSFKHAFKGRDKGIITISLKNNEEEKLTLQISDNGIGMPDQGNIDVHTSLGMTLIKTLAKQLNAKFNYGNDKGLVFEFKFGRES